jgi:hypothetical protein
MNKIFKLLLFFNFLITGALCAQERQSIDYELQIEWPGLGEKFEGIKLNGDGLYLARYSLKRRLFLPDVDFYYDSLHIPIYDLDPIQLYRLNMFLKTHNMLERVGFKNRSPCERPVRYQILYNAERKVIFDNEYCYNQCDNINRFIISELKILIDGLIEDRYERFRISFDYGNYDCL